MGSTKPLSESVTRFWAKVDKRDPGGCWLWTAFRDYGGYGKFSAGGKMVRAHRAAYELVVGPIPDGLTLDHLCRNRACVNPAHLEPVTNRENILRGTSPSAIAATRTHCKRGHPYDERRRKCRICDNEMRRERVRRALCADENPQ